MEWLVLSILLVVTVTGNVEQQLHSLNSQNPDKVQNTFSQLSSDEVVKAIYNSYNSPQWGTICWSEKIVLNVFVNGLIQAHKEYAISFQVAANYPKYPPTEGETYEVYDPDTKGKQILKFKTIEETANATIKEHHGIRCKSVHAYSKIFMESAQKKRAEVKMKVVLDPRTIRLVSNHSNGTKITTTTPSFKKRIMETMQTSKNQPSILISQASTAATLQHQANNTRATTTSASVSQSTVTENVTARSLSSFQNRNLDGSSSGTPAEIISRDTLVCPENGKIILKMNLSLVDDSGEARLVEKQVELDLNQYYNSYDYSQNLDGAIKELIKSYYGESLDKYKRCSEIYTTQRPIQEQFVKRLLPNYPLPSVNIQMRPDGTFYAMPTPTTPNLLAAIRDTLRSYYT